MQTKFTAEFLDTPIGRQIDKQFRACVHCGFCNASCPTYQLTGDELDGPRGRIYLMQSMLEGHDTTDITQTHLDRCLSCLSCESTCPSGVRYGEIKDYAQSRLDKQQLRSRRERSLRWLLRNMVSSRSLFKPAWKLAQWLKPLLPEQLQPVTLVSSYSIESPHTAKQQRTASTALILHGCAQSVIAPHVNRQLQNLLQNCGVNCVQDHQENCCGALHYHNGDHDKAKSIMFGNITRWNKLLDDTDELKIVTAASGCGQMISQYAKIFAHDDKLSKSAARISAALTDAGELLPLQNLAASDGSIRRVSLHLPCTLQHGIKNHRLAKEILLHCGYELMPVEDAHLCCGSAGTYSILQSELSGQLLDNKLQKLTASQPDCIATANIGCQMHLQSKTRTPVLHWLELIKTEK